MNIFLLTPFSTSLDPGIFTLRGSDFNTITNYDLVQEYIKNEGDYRVLIIGNTVVGSFFKKRTSGIVNNLGKGAEGLKKQLPKEITDELIVMTDVLGYDVAGIDIMQSVDGVWYLIEVNRAPGFIPSCKYISKDIIEEFYRMLGEKLSGG